MSKTSYYKILSFVFFLGGAVLQGFGEGGAIVADSSERVKELRCERLTDPAGIDARVPRLGWWITGEERGLRQVAYQILVASSSDKLDRNQGDLWNSGKVVSGQSQQVDYAGIALKSRMGCYWKVKVWTRTGIEIPGPAGADGKKSNVVSGKAVTDGKILTGDKMATESAWSASAFWSMGLLEQTDWHARWIGYDQRFPWDSVSKFSRLSARYFRKEFVSGSPVKKAVVYIIGLGHYELTINGRPIGDQVLAEAPTDYTRTVKYNTFDVASAIRQGGNVLGVVLGNGRFFTMRPKYKPKKIKEFGFPKLLLQLEIEYANGTHQRIVSDGSWKFTADGPIRSNNEYDGEEYDATKELGEWNRSGYKDTASWLNPQLVAAPGGRIDAQMNEPIRVMDSMRPVVITEQRPGTWILDMGQNMSGWVQMKVRGERGDKVTLRFGETLQKNGALYTANLRDAKATDVYTLKGGEMETWHPVFVYHGFRYVEITGYPGKPSIDDFEGQVVYDGFATIGGIVTSNHLINGIFRNAYWGILSNYKGMPLDCPQRNERMPWLGDRAAGCMGESYVFDNENLYAKWLDDIEEAQKPDGSLPDVAPAYWNYYSDNMTWPGTYILVAATLYRQFGDRRSIGKHYASMKKWLDYMRRKYVKNDIMTKDKYGDWCVPPESPELIHSRDSLRNTNGQLIATAYYYRLLGIMESFAKLLHKSQDQKEFSVLAGKAKDAFNARFLDKTTFRYDNNTVTANLLPLYFNMVPMRDEDAVFNNIVYKIEKENNGHTSTGVVGGQWLMEGLTKYGRPDLALRIASNDDYPSWGYMLKEGATTIWELWNGNTANPAMNSHNHIMLLGDLITWLYKDLAGIGTLDGGYRTIYMNPSMPDSLTEVQANYQTPYGLIKSSWRREEGTVYWDITIPANTSAEVHLPTQEEDKVQESGHGLRMVKDIRIEYVENRRIVLSLGAGIYHFKIQP